MGNGGNSFCVSCDAIDSNSFCVDCDAVDGGSFCVNCNAVIPALFCANRVAVRVLSDCWASSAFAPGSLVRPLGRAAGWTRIGVSDTEVPFKSICRQEIDRLSSPPSKSRYCPLPL